MKPRHAAAPAPVGWYLMMPLVQKGKRAVSDTPPDSTATKTSTSKRGQLHYISFHARVDPKAPLSKWMMMYYSDSMRGCQAVLKKLNSPAKKNSNPPKGLNEKESAKWMQMNQMLAANAKCVASGDLRLKGNEHVRMFQLITPRSRARMFERFERELKRDTPNRK